MGTSFAKLTLVLAAATLLSACGIHALNGTAMRETSAETRVILEVPRELNDDGTRKLGKRIYCAEPSPDIAKLLSSSTGVDLKAAANMGPQAFEAAIGFSRAQSEGVAQLTRRLATIQILRDAFYRACEAYANGAIDETGYALVLSQSDSLILGLLSIELIADSHRDPLLAVSSEAKNRLEAKTIGAIAGLDRVLDTGKQLDTAKALVRKLAADKGLDPEQLLANSALLPQDQLPSALQQPLKRVLGLQSQLASQQNSLLRDQLQPLQNSLGALGALPALPGLGGSDGSGAASNRVVNAGSGGNALPVGAEVASIIARLLHDAAVLPTLKSLEVSCIHAMSWPLPAASAAALLRVQSAENRLSVCLGREPEAQKLCLPPAEDAAETARNRLADVIEQGKGPPLTPLALSCASGLLQQIARQKLLHRDQLLKAGTQAQAAKPAAANKPGKKRRRGH